MALSLVVRKEEETPTHCLYAFGGPDTPVGRARLYKDAGDVELVDLAAADAPARGPFYLSHVLPRLQGYHDAGTYPDTDRWMA